MLKFCLSDIHWSSGTAVEHMPHKQASGLGSNPDKLWFFSFNHQKCSFIQVQQRPIFTKITCLGLHSAPWGETSLKCTYNNKELKMTFNNSGSCFWLKVKAWLGPLKRPVLGNHFAVVTSMLSGTQSSLFHGLERFWRPSDDLHDPANEPSHCLSAPPGVAKRFPIQVPSWPNSTQPQCSNGSLTWFLT